MRGVERALALALMGLLVSLAGCAAVPLSPAVQSPAASLRAQAREALAAGNAERAGALLERALRIAPQDAQSWLALGQLRLGQGDQAAAAALARKALTLAGEDRRLAAEAERLLEQARQ